jgi:hypothetical protein
LPKISATRNPDKPFAEDVVKKAAEENPQKLRQIGLNYDLAHVKGGFEEEEEERKKKAEAKAKNAKAEKEKKEKDEKEKAEKEKQGKKDGTKTESKDEDKKEGNKDEVSESEKDKEKIKPEVEKTSADTETAKKEGDEPSTDAAKPEVEEAPNPWNAVAVIGLRAYSKDADLVVTLVKPKDPEEAAMLDVDGISGAGATA